MRILCIGDSNTWGYNPADGFRHKNRWTKILADKLSDCEILEEGLNGRTILSKDPYMPERCCIDNLKMILMSHKPVDLIVLMLGTNELKTIFPGTAEYIAIGIDRCLNLILDRDLWERFQVPQVLVVSPIHIREEFVKNGSVFWGEFDENSITQSVYMGEEINKVCNKYKVSFIDGADYAEASIIDCIHMDEENHRRLAEGIYAGIKKIL